MAIDCDSPSFLYPLYADVYYPIITQGGYGEINKKWVFDKTINCNAMTFSSKKNEDIKPAEFLKYEGLLVSRAKTDIRTTSNNQNEALTNILITNIRTVDGEVIYKETSGPRSGKGTIFEIATFEPFVGPFRSVEYFKMIWRRTENQSVGD